MSWQDFLARFNQVLDDLLRHMGKARAEQHHVVTALMLDPGHPAKSSAWLSGYAWTRLAGQVDFVIKDWGGVQDLARLLHESEADRLSGFSVPLAARGGRGREYSGSEAANSEDEDESSSPMSVSPPSTPPHYPSYEQGEDVVRVPRFLLQVLYLDDMVYSGQQLSDNAFAEDLTYTSYATGRLLNTAPGFTLDPKDVRFYLGIPFMATGGVERLRQAAYARGLPTPSISKHTHIIAPFNDLVADVLAEFRHVQGDLLRETPEGRKIENDLLTLLTLGKPAIVFEHKLADDVSLPSELFYPEKGQRRPLFLPHLVEQGGHELTLETTDTVFYKKGGMEWRGRQQGQLLNLTDFSRLWAHFLAGQAHMESALRLSEHNPAAPYFLVGLK